MQGVVNQIGHAVLLGPFVLNAFWHQVKRDMVLSEVGDLLFKASSFYIVGSLCLIGLLRRINRLKLWLGYSLAGPVVIYLFLVVLVGTCELV